MISGQIITDTGYCYSWLGKAVPRETKIKPMTCAWREYNVVLATLAEQEERGLLKFKLDVLRKFLSTKGMEYVSIARHLEVVEEW